MHDGGAYQYYSERGWPVVGDELGEMSETYLNFVARCYYVFAREKLVFLMLKKNEC